MPVNIAGNNRVAKHRDAIRDAYKRGQTTTQLARSYECSVSTIYDLVEDLVEQFSTSSARVRARRYSRSFNELERREKAAFRHFDELGDKVSYDRWQEARNARIEAQGAKEASPRTSKFY